LKAYDDGNGPALYAGGKFRESDPGGAEGVNFIAKWNGISWEPLSEEAPDEPVYFMEVFDDAGNGADLYISGGFTEVGGMEAHTIARWGCSPAFLAMIAEPVMCPDLGETLTVTLSMSKLGAFPAAGFEAFISFDDSSLSFISGAYTAEPFGLHIIDPITADGGNIDMAASIDEGAGQTPTSADADLVALTFEVVGENCGMTLAFRNPPAESRIVDPNGAGPPYGLATLDSANIVVDTTPVTITECPSDIAVDVNPGETGAAVDPGEPSVADNCDVTVVGTRDDGLPLTDPYPVHTTTTITWTVEDVCGHVDECTQHIIVGVRGILHVDADASAGGDGAEWATAFNDLQEAISAIGSEYEIRVAQGTYAPDSGTGDRTASFTLINEVAIRGGYAGWGEPNPDLRDVSSNVTILSGDLDSNDAGANGREENSYHVVMISSGTDETAVLDGFTITGGHANGSSPDECGAGMYNLTGNPTVTNCTFRDNWADCGGGLCNLSGSPILANCTFHGNSATDTGGGIYSAGVPVVTNCIFSGNWATRGGGMYSTAGTPTLVNCTFSGNTAVEAGAGVYNAGNTPTLANCVLWGNVDNDGMDESAQLHIDGATPVVDYSCLQGWTGALGGTGNLGDDPLFVRNPDAGGDGWGDDPSTPAVDEGANDDHGDLRLQSDSPCADAADNTGVPTDLADLDGDGDTTEPIPIGLDGRLRFAEGLGTADTGNPDPNFPEFAIVDMGAYEYQCTGDLDGDGGITLSDLAQLVGNYGMTSGATYEGGDLDGDGDVDLTDLAEMIGLYGTVCIACPGDLTGDNVVSLSDLAQLVGHYGMAGALYADGDLDCDGDVDLSDLASLLGVYGTVCW
jgi:predicted outer membrane repeat protein